MVLASFEAFTRVEAGAAARSEAYDLAIRASPLQRDQSAAENRQLDVEFQTSLSRLFGVIVTASLFTLVFALLFIYLIYRNAQDRIARLLALTR